MFAASNCQPKTFHSDGFVLSGFNEVAFSRWVPIPEHIF
jgi:hypothetical protein